jgi:hypothetical protein
MTYCEISHKIGCVLHDNNVNLYSNYTQDPAELHKRTCSYSYRPEVKETAWSPSQPVITRYGLSQHRTATTITVQGKFLYIIFSNEATGFVYWPQNELWTSLVIGPCNYPSVLPSLRSLSTCNNRHVPVSEFLHQKWILCCNSSVV